jgi:hypothetical protein
VIRAGLKKHNDLQKGGQFSSKREPFLIRSALNDLLLSERRWNDGQKLHSQRYPGELAAVQVDQSGATYAPRFRPPPSVNHPAHSSPLYRCTASNACFSLGYESQTQTDDSCGGGDRLQQKGWVHLLEPEEMAQGTRPCLHPGPLRPLNSCGSISSLTL